MGEKGQRWASHQHAVQQSALHDALLHSAVRFCFEDSLRPPSHFLHRPFDSRAAHPHVRLHRVMLTVLATIGLNRFAPGPIAGWLIALLWIAFVTQILLSIRYVYRQGWFFSVFKFFFGGFVY